VALNVPAPLVRVESAGSVAVPSRLGTLTVAASRAPVMLKASSAVTVKLKAVPDATLAGAETLKCVTAPALTAMVFEVPVIEPSADRKSVVQGESGVGVGVQARVGKNESARSGALPRRAAR